MALHNPLPAKHSNETRTVQLRQALVGLTEAFPAIEDIYLFGSRRHRSGSFRSDVDLLVRAGQSWLEQGVASGIWGIEPYFDIFAADGGAAVSLANGSRIEASDFEALVAKLDAVPVWAHGEWCGDPHDELQVVLKDVTPTYTNVHPTYLDGAPLLVMCALPQEFVAIRERLGTTDSVPEYFAEGGATVQIGRVGTTSGDETVVAISLMPRMGNVSAALATLDAIDSVRPSRAVLSGIAAGLRDVTQLGDIVVPEVIVGYEATKATSEGEAFHGSMPEAKPQLIAQVKGWSGAAAWSDRWTAERAEVPVPEDAPALEGDLRLLFDAMASGEKVVADAARAERLTDFNRKVISVEMEAFGFSAACIRRDVPFIVVKSITDYADATKNDAYHDFCCHAAADLVAELVTSGIL